VPEHGQRRTGWLVFRLSALELWRNPLGLVLLAVIPAVFIGMILWTASENSIPLKVFFGDETVQVLLTQRQVGLVFVSAAVSGFLAAYYALILFHNDFGYFRFCVFMGLSPRCSRQRASLRSWASRPCWRLPRPSGWAVLRRSNSLSRFSPDSC